MRLIIRVALVLLWAGAWVARADTIHIVKPGETLAGICRDYDTPVEVVQKANNLKPGAAMRPGLRLFIPGAPIPAPPPGQPDPPKTSTRPGSIPPPGKVIGPTGPSDYTVRTGDTLFSLSRRFTTTPDKIRALNGLTTEELKVGQHLKLREESDGPAPIGASDAPPGRILPTEREVAAIKSRLAEGSPNVPAKIGEKTPENEERVPPSGPVSVPVPPPTRVPGAARPAEPEGGELEPEGAKPIDPRRTSSTPMRAIPPPPEPVASDEGVVSRPASTRYVFLKRIKDQIDDVPFRASRWKYVVLHHSGTNNGNAKIFDYYHRHERGMPNGLAYHFVIGNGRDSGDGEIEVGPRWTKQLQGGHVHSDALNEISIGICFVGDYNKYRPTKKQIAAAVELIAYLNDKCDHELVLKAHREINPRPTDCPGKYFPIRAFHQLFN